MEKVDSPSLIYCVSATFYLFSVADVFSIVQVENVDSRVSHLNITSRPLTNLAQCPHHEYPTTKKEDPRHHSVAPGFPASPHE